jgi:hypothetical protein
MFEALEGGELGVVIQNFEDISLVVEICDSVGTSKVGVKEFEYPCRYGIFASRGKGSLSVGHDARLTEAIGVLPGLIELGFREGEAIHHLLANMRPLLSMPRCPMRACHTSASVRRAYTLAASAA